MTSPLLPLALLMLISCLLALYLHIVASLCLYELGLPLRHTGAACIYFIVFRVFCIGSVFSMLNLFLRNLAANLVTDFQQLVDCAFKVALAMTSMPRFHYSAASLQMIPASHCKAEVVEVSSLH